MLGKDSENYKLVKEHVKLYLYSLLLSLFYFISNTNAGRWAFVWENIPGYIFSGSFLFLTCFLSMEVAGMIANESEHVLALTLE
jgi:hypothetical protein